MEMYTDKYFTLSRIVAFESGINPVVKYRVFMRIDGVVALKPAVQLIKALQPNAIVKQLPEGTHFKAGDTLMTIEGKFQDIVELETLYLQWIGLPCYCAYEARKIANTAQDLEIIDMAARHLPGVEAVALASYGAKVGGINASSTDIGANAFEILAEIAHTFSKRCFDKAFFRKSGVGTVPHALIALFRGDYSKLVNAYLKALPKERLIVLIDYNNKEIEDAKAVWNEFGDKVYGFRVDTSKENRASIGKGYYNEAGVTPEIVTAFKKELPDAKLFLSSGFNAAKIDRFKEILKFKDCYYDGVGTGSYIPNIPSATSDICEVNFEKETKKGREWGWQRNEVFESIIGIGA